MNGIKKRKPKNDYQGRKLISDRDLERNVRLEIAKEQDSGKHKNESNKK